MSNVWRGITENAKWVHKGSAMAVGNGRSTLFWDHRWASDDALCSLASGPIHSDIKGATVEEMWEPGVGWKWDLFAHLLPSLILQNIATLKVVENETCGDLRYWKGSRRGEFSIKYAMDIMRDDLPPQPCGKWDLAWRAPVQQRIRVFLWLLFHERILCNTNRVDRHLTKDPRCVRCTTNSDEILLHLFQDCPAARAIWASLGGPAKSPNFFSANLQT